MYMVGSSAIKCPKTTHTAGITKLKQDIFNIENSKKIKNKNKNIERFVMAQCNESTRFFTT